MQTKTERGCVRGTAEALSVGNSWVCDLEQSGVCRFSSIGHISSEAIQMRPGQLFSMSKTKTVFVVPGGVNEVWMSYCGLQHLGPSQVEKDWVAWR